MGVIFSLDVFYNFVFFFLIFYNNRSSHNIHSSGRENHLYKHVIIIINNNNNNKELRRIPYQNASVPLQQRMVVKFYNCTNTKRTTNDTRKIPVLQNKIAE